jgi:6-phosphogluconolactonase (cycloisomerase 2 family)
MTAVAIESQELTLSELIKLAKKSPVFITEKGKTRYALVAVDEGDVEAYALGSNEAFIAYLQAARERARREGTISIDEMRRRLNIPEGTSA